MGKSSSAKAEVTEYRMSLHIGVALKLDSIRKITVDEKAAWSGSVANNTTLTINRPDLFGGEKKEGGLIGAIDVLMGDANQVLPAQSAARYGKAANDCPAFRGITSLMFRGSGQISAGQFNVWQYLAGNWNGGVGANGFVWKHNSPIIAQKIEVEGTSAPKTPLNPAYAMIANPDHPTRPDANPIHIIYEALVDDEFGMGASADAIDTAAFEAAAATLFNENFGLTILWMRQSKIEDLVNEILQHIQATMFADPTTGLLSIKLHRDDYVVNDLFVLSPDNAKLSKYRVRSPGEIVNAITVSWTNPENEQAESITAHNLASVASQGGETVSANRDYYGIRHAKLAREILARDLREASAPLVSCEATIDRSAWHLKPGDVVLLNWPRRNLYGLVMRVGKVNYGKPGSTTVRVPLVQDVFSLSHPPIVIDPGTGWVDPSADPKPLTMQLTTLPTYFTRNASVQSVPVEIVEPEVLAMSLADSQDDDSLDYELVAQTAGPDGAPVPLSRGALTMTPLAYLGATLSAAATSELPATLFPDINWAPVVGGFVFIGYGDLNQEIALVTGTTATGWTIERGCLDTTPRTWVTGTPVWAVNPGSSVVDVQTIHAAGETVTYRGLDRTSKGLLAFEDAPDVTATLTERPHLPLRPANVTIGGVGFGSYDVSAAGSFEITWATRNRLLEDTQVLRWTDGPVAPEHRQETIVRAYDVATETLVHERAYLWLDNSLVFSKSDFDRYQSVRFEVLSRRDDRLSLTGHSIVVTGFANNPAAPPPPVGPARTPPPSVIAAPAVAAFVAVSVTQTGDNHAQAFSVEIAGSPDRLDMGGLVARYRVLGDIEWTTLPLVALDGEPLVIAIPGLRPATVYETGVAYVQDGIVGQFRDLADVTTGTSGPITPDDFDTTPPAQPGVITITPGSRIGTDGAAILTLVADWPDNGESDLDGYTAEWYHPQRGVIRSVRVTASRDTLEGVTAGEDYQITVWAVDRLGNISAGRAGVATAVGDTTAPGLPVVVTAPTSGPRRIWMQWGNPSDADFDLVEIARNTTGSNAALASQIVFRSRGTAWADDTIAVGVTYHYWMRSKDRTGNPSAWVSMGSAVGRYIRVADGDILNTDPVLVTQYGTANQIANQSRFATVTSISLADADVYAPYASLESVPARLNGHPTFGDTYLNTSVLIYGNGAGIDALRPAEAGANVTETRTALQIQNQAAWATYSAHTPANIAPRVAAGLDASGDLARNVPLAILNGSNVLRYAGGAAYTGDLAATVGARAGTNLYRTDGTTVMTQGEVRTAEGVALQVQNQGALATQHRVTALQVPYATVANSFNDEDFTTNLITPVNGAAFDTSAETTSTLGVVKSIKSPSGVGKAAGAQDQLTVFSSSDMYVGVAAGGTFRFTGKGLIKQGFTGLFRAFLYFTNTSGGTLGGPTVVTLADKRAVAQSADAVVEFDQQITVPTGAARCYFTYIIDWSTTQTNGGYILIAKPGIRFVADFAAIHPNAVRFGSNVRRNDGSTLVNDADAITALGEANRVQGQGEWATYLTYTPAQIAPRVAAGLDANGDIARDIPAARLTSSGAARTSELTDGTIVPLQAQTLPAMAPKVLSNGLQEQVAIQMFTLEAGDGEVVTFGKTYPVPPIVIPAGVDNLDALVTAGDYYQTHPDNVTTTGFTGRARRRNPGTSPTYTNRLDDGAPNASGSNGQFSLVYRQKLLSGVAHDGGYHAKINCVVQGTLQNTRSMTVGFYGRQTATGPWVLLGSRTFTSDVGTTPTSFTDQIISGSVGWTTWDAHGDYEYKVEIISGYLAGVCYLTNFTSVAYSEQTGGSGAVNVTALSGGKKMKYMVFPLSG